MSRRTSIALLVTLQLALVAVYLLVERRRSEPGPGSGVLGTAPPLAVGGVLPPLRLERRDGSRFDARAARGPLLLHLWASWCPPCREELPGLLAMSGRGLQVAAVSLDADWGEIEDFLAGRRVPELLLGDAAQVAERLGVRSLPVTFLVEPGGRLRLRFDGARDWADEAFVRSWMSDAAVAP